MLRKCTTPYLRDVYLAYLITDARRTTIDEYPIIEEWMVATEPPKEIIQWDRRCDTIDHEKTAISFYCCDPGFQPILNNPKNYVDKFKKYQCLIGLDASPYDNMPIVVQKSQIFLNLACTYFYGSKGIKIIPNVRLGDDRTLSSLEAYPKHTLIAIGTHGFTKRIDNRVIFAKQVQRLVDELEPSGICVYGPATEEIFGYARLKGIPIYQYDSYTMKENAKDKKRKLSEGEHER
ncbi:MAG: DUF4417 domain-containing protein [Bacilli bacterium]|nr:DUF4417 domain-containing protein [Bacilli bacterium]